MSSEKSLGIIAIIISVFALAVSVWQAVDNRNFNKLSIRPHLQVSPNLTSVSESGLYLENAGTGTAFIHSIKLNIKGKSFDLIENSSTDFFKFTDVKPNCYRESWPRRGAAIQAGKEFPLISVTKSDKPLCGLAAIEFLTEPGITINISYSSPYGEIFELSDSISLTERELGEYFELINKIKNMKRRVYPAS
ncbi:hypothetical protein [Microbulbifer sp. TRSA005]|uniref:hypothetical protein n=1 Tax=Microbulbifer sp. TRSA005 TaxID=3243383 RepID=UPI0040390B8B